MSRTTEFGKLMRAWSRQSMQDAKFVFNGATLAASDTPEDCGWVPGHAPLNIQAVPQGGGNANASDDAFANRIDGSVPNGGTNGRSRDAAKPQATAAPETA